LQDAARQDNFAGAESAVFKKHSLPEMVGK